MTYWTCLKQKKPPTDDIWLLTLSPRSCPRGTCNVGRGKNPLLKPTRDIENELWKRTPARGEMTDPAALTLNPKCHLPQRSFDFRIQLPQPGWLLGVTNRQRWQLALWQRKTNSSHPSESSFRRELSSLVITTSRLTIEVDLMWRKQVRLSAGFRPLWLDMETPKQSKWPKTALSPTISWICLEELWWG